MFVVMVNDKNVKQANSLKIAASYFLTHYEEIPNSRIERRTAINYVAETWDENFIRQFFKTHHKLKHVQLGLFDNPEN